MKRLLVAALCCLPLAACGDDDASYNGDTNYALEGEEVNPKEYLDEQIVNFCNSKGAAVKFTAFDPHYLRVLVFCDDLEHSSRTINY